MFPYIFRIFNLQIHIVCSEKQTYLGWQNLVLLSDWGVNCGRNYVFRFWRLWYKYLMFSLTIIQAKNECITETQTLFYAWVDENKCFSSLRLYFLYLAKIHLWRLSKSPQTQFSQSALHLSFLSLTLSLYLCAFPPISCSNLPLIVWLTFPSQSLFCPYMETTGKGFSYKVLWPEEGRQTEERPAILYMKNPFINTYKFKMRLFIFILHKVLLLLWKQSKRDKGKESGSVAIVSIFWTKEIPKRKRSRKWNKNWEQSQRESRNKFRGLKWTFFK